MNIIIKEESSSDWVPTVLIKPTRCAECSCDIVAGNLILLSKVNEKVVCMDHAILEYESYLKTQKNLNSIERITEEIIGKETNETIEKIIGKKPSRFMEFVLACSLFSVIIVIIFLSIDLPSSYTTKNWDIAWVGFDLGLLFTLALTLWAIWKQRQVSIISSAICGAILIIDSWFDVATSNGGRDLYSAIATAVFLQVPFALLLFRFSKNVMHRSLENSYNKVGMVAPKTSFFKTPLNIFREE